MDFYNGIIWWIVCLINLYLDFVLLLSISELHTNLLHPRIYYDLYMTVIGELNRIEAFFMSVHSKSTPIVDTYQRIQGDDRFNKSMAVCVCSIEGAARPPIYHSVSLARCTLNHIHFSACTKALPRLYLLFAAGVCCIKSKEVPISDVLSDMLEMAKGIQDPMKGLFLRNYLGHISTVLPANESSLLPPYEAKEGITMYAVQFLLTNLSECNKLWVRLHNRSKTNKCKNENMRKDLRLLVGTNLVRLSRLEGVTARVYKEVILPNVLEDIIACRDTVSQSYLMDCLIQVFPDSFHIYAVEPFLNGVVLLKEKVKVRMIMESFLHRVGEYVKKTPNAIPEDSSVISLLDRCVTRLIEERKDPNVLPELLHIQAAAINFLGLCVSSPHVQMERIKEALDTCQIALHTRATIEPNHPVSPATASALKAILSVSLNVIGLHVLELRPFNELLHGLPVTNQRHMAADILASTVKANQPLVDLDVLGNLLSSIGPLLLDIPFEPSLEDSETEGKGDGADLASRVAALVGIGCTPPIRYQLYCLTRDRFLEGSAPFSARTLVPLVFSALQLALEVRHIELDPVADTKTDPTPVPVKVVIEPPRPPDSTPSKNSRVDLAFDEVEELEGKDSKADPNEVSPYGSNNESPKRRTSSPASPVVVDEEPPSPPSPTSSDADQENKKPYPTNSSAGEQDRSLSPPSLATNKEQDQDISYYPPSTPPTDAVMARVNANAVLEGLSSRKVFQFVHEVVTGIAPQVPALALKLFLQCAVAADKAHLQAIAYEFMSQSYILYEDEIVPEYKNQLRSIICIAGTLRACRNFSADDYESLVTKTAQYASKVQKKSDQCHVVLLCSHLFYRSDIDKTQKEDDPYHDSRRVLECLKRCLKLADACAVRNGSSKTHSIFLFLAILHHYIYFLKAGCNAVTVKIIRTLVTLIRDRVGEIEDPTARQAISSDVERRLSLALYTLVQMGQQDGGKQQKIEEGMEEKSRASPTPNEQQQQALPMTNPTN